MSAKERAAKRFECLPGFIGDFTLLAFWSQVKDSAFVQAIPSPAGCCDTSCPTPTSQGPPGIQGATGDDGADGTNGVNAFTAVADYDPNPQPSMPYPIQVLSTTLAAGSTTAVLASTATIIPGMRVSGTGIAAGTTVVSVDSATDITLSLQATANGAQSITYKDQVTVNTTTSTAFMTVGEISFVQTWGYMLVLSLPGATSVQLENIENATTGVYPDNAAQGTTLAAALTIVPGGLQGATGTAGSSGAPDTATFITQTVDAALTNSQALDSLFTGYMKVTTATGAVTSQVVPIPIADGGTAAITETLARASLVVAPNTAAFILKTANAELASAQVLSTLATGYMKVTTATGAITSQAAPIPVADLAFPPVITTTVAMALTSAHSTVLVNAAAALVIDLPTAVGITGKTYTVKKIDSNVLFTVGIDPNLAETIDGAAAISLSAQWSSVTIQSNGTGWFIIAVNP